MKGMRLRLSSRRGWRSLGEGPVCVEAAFARWAKALGEAQFTAMSEELALCAANGTRKKQGILGRPYDQKSAIKYGKGTLEDLLRKNVYSHCDQLLARGKK